MTNITTLTTLPSTHPEIGPGNLGTSVDRTAGATSGVVVFNRPSVLTQDPMTTIESAIASGDTMKRRAEQFSATMLPEQK